MKVKIAIQKTYLLLAIFCLYLVNLNAQVIPTNKIPVGSEHNVLFDAHNRYTVTQSGPLNFDFNRLFDGSFLPSYAAGVISQSAPHEIVIEGLPERHPQHGAWVGWSTRGHTPKHFKIEGFNIYDDNNPNTNYPVNDWVTLDEVTDNPYSNTDYLHEIGNFIVTKLRFTFYETASSVDYLGLSELYFIHPEAVTPYQGLFAGPKGYIKNLLPLEDWSEGTGGISIFKENTGPTNPNPIEENTRLFEQGPYGNQVLLWEAKSDGVGNHADGGWDADFIIDHEKTLRYMVWVKRPNGICGSTYLGCRSGSTENINGSTQNASNPYFFKQPLPTDDKWYLIVGYVHGSGYQGTENYGGLYDGETGEKIQDLPDFKNTVGASIQRHRSYLFYCNQANSKQYFWGASVEEVNGNELPIEAYFPNYGGGGQWQLANDGIYYNTGSTVGIGILNPDILDPAYKLMVDGVIKAREVKVNPEGWADYVFEPDYKLPQLSDVEQHILDHGHLPDIPNADEVATNGILLGKMDAILLRKIEELTLYIIEQEKHIEELKDYFGGKEESMIQIMNINEDLLKRLDVVEKKLEK